MIIQGDCLEKLKSLDDNSIDSIVTDPPYGLSFMNKKWDYQVPSKEIWIEALRVLKPGGHLLAFGGTRTYHRLVVNIEDAGFEIRDQIQWLYGSGFPKSTDVSKRIDKEAGATREVVGFNSNHRSLKETNCMVGEPHSGDGSLTAPSTDQAKQYQGWGTALKPANEPICVARKPLEKGLTLAANVLKWGCGAINIDESRIEAKDQDVLDAAVKRMTGNEITNANSKNFLEGQKSIQPNSAQGRWPANIILDETAAEMLDEQSGHLKGGGQNYSSNSESMFGTNKKFSPSKFAGDSGGASRFFYCAKASKSERNRGLEGMPEKEWKDQGFRDNDSTHLSPRAGAGRTSANQNHHPTVKPIKLMEYLIRLVTPKGGTTLDPFMGSGSTGVAAKNLGFQFIGIELNPEYAEIAEKRIEAS